MKKYIAAFAAFSAVLSLFAREKWTEAQANSWYAAQPFYAGANFIPSNAINQIEMWSCDTFSPDVIDRELGWAQSIGFNAMRVFLSDVVWNHEGDRFFDNIEKYLQIADKHGIKTLFVIFDSCWAANSSYGKQPEPKLCKHNSGWVKSPSLPILKDKSKWNNLENYVKALVSRFKDDPRILGWDVYNEPGNLGVTVAENGEFRGDKDAMDKMLELLKLTFVWARSQNPSQPITSGTWGGKLVKEMFDSTQIAESDILSFHNYGSKGLKGKIAEFKKLNRPILCTEYMARPNSTFDPDLGVLKSQKVAAFNWGLVSGKTQTIYSWQSNRQQWTPDKLTLWFHDVFYESGIPYSQKEVSYIKKIMGK